MSNADDARREQRLMRELFDSVGGSAGAVDPDMERELSELREVERRLLSAGRAELEQLLREGHDPELEEAARRSLERLMSAEDAQPEPRARRWPWLALAAAVLLALGWVVWGPRADPSHEGLVLGAGEVELVRPRGEVPAYDAFEWRGELPTGGHFELRVWSADADPLAAPIFEEECTEPRWTPPDPSALPDALRWEVVARGAGGEVLGRSEEEASRSSP